MNNQQADAAAEALLAPGRDALDRHSQRRQQAAEQALLHKARARLAMALVMVGLALGFLVASLSAYNMANSLFAGGVVGLVIGWLIALWRYRGQ